MWHNIDFNLLINIFFYLPLDSLACASSVSKYWHKCVVYVSSMETQLRHPAWFIALPLIRNRVGCARVCGPCYANNPTNGKWHALPLPLPITEGEPEPIGTVGGLIILLKSVVTNQLASCNPFNMQYKVLPTPSVKYMCFYCIVELDNDDPNSLQRIRSPHFSIYVVGTTETSDHTTIEMYDSQHDMWQVIGSGPYNITGSCLLFREGYECVYSDGALYWVCNEGKHIVLSLDIGTRIWRKLEVPLAGRLEFAALVPRDKKVTLVGGTTGGGDGCVWELGEGDVWRLIDKVPDELKVKFLHGIANWRGTECVGSNGAMCLYRNAGSRMIMCRREVAQKEKWEWTWAEGLNGTQSFAPKKGFFLHPDINIPHLQNM